MQKIAGNHADLESGDLGPLFVGLPPIHFSKGEGPAPISYSYSIGGKAIMDYTGEMET
jgi:hypothetical protein